MKFYSKKTLKNFTKKELIEYIELLQHNLKNEENLSNHMYSIINAVMKKDTSFSKAVGEVLDVWNKNNGHRYEVEEWAIIRD